MTLRRIALIAAACILPLFLQLGSRGLYEPDEARYAEISREMVATGDWVVPRLKGVPHWAKPPLSYQVTALSMSVFGVTPFAARLPSALAALIVALVVARLAGLSAAVMLVVSLEFFVLARTVNTDMLLLLSIATAWLAFWRWYEGEGKSRRWLLLLWASLGLGFLVKGPVAAAVVFSTLLVFRVLSRQVFFRQLLRGFEPVVFLVIAAPWFVMVISREPLLFDHYLGREVGGRLADGLGRTRPWWFFLAVAPAALLPWTHLVMRRVASVLRQKPRSTSLDVFAVAAILGPLILFSISRSKVWTYILPITVPAAILVARTMGDRLTRRAWGVVIATHVLLASAFFHVPRDYAVDVGRSLGFDPVAAALPERNFVGAPIPARLGPSTEPPRLSTEGTRLVTYRFRFLAAAFHTLGERPEFVPNFGGGSLHEILRNNREDRRLTLADLAELATEAVPLVIVTKARFRAELEAAVAGLVLIADVTCGREDFLVFEGR